MTKEEKYLKLVLLMIKDTKGPELKNKFIELGSSITEEQIDEMIVAPFVQHLRYPTEHGFIGYDTWPVNGESMTSMQSLEFLHRAAKDVIDRKIEGDIVETGVWKGGSIIAMKAAFDLYGDINRKFYVCDSFEGCPPLNVYNVEINGVINDHGDRHYMMSRLSISEEDVVENFKKYSLLDDRVIIVKGWFHNTMPVVAKHIEKISILRLDGDMYISTKPVLDELYDKLQPGGYFITDDVGLANHDRAIEEFRKKHNITTPLIRARGNDDSIDRLETNEGYVHYWIKE